MTRVQLLRPFTAVFLALAIGITPEPGNSMVDPSMLVYQWSGTELATKPLALKIASSVFQQVYHTKEDFQLKSVEAADRWIITADVKVGSDDISNVNNKVPATLYIEIMKSDCQVVKLVRKIGL
jgi:hypothetical protein